MRIVWRTLGLLLLLPLLDKLWFSTLGDWYLGELESILLVEDGAIRPRLDAAAGVYLLMAIGMAYFVLGLEKPLSLPHVFGRGILFGLILFGVYDLTNRAVLEAWPWSVVLVDMIWGAILCSLAPTILGSLERLTVQSNS